MAITVKSGANSVSLEDVSGRSICEIRSTFENLWRIPSDASVQLNGSTVEDEQLRLRDGDEVAFMQAVAQKG